ncbi:MAG: helix-turn-helix domain-containing protein [Billgrantia sp.]
MTESKENSGESEGQKNKRSEVPILLSEIGSRISEISRPYGKKGFAARARISESHLYRYLQGKSDPTATRIVAMAKAAKVRPGWLLTGEMPKAEGVRVEERPDPHLPKGLGPGTDPATGEGSPDKGAQTPAKQGFAGGEIDLDLLESVAATTLQELETRRIHLEPAAQARLLRVLYRHFASKGEQPDHDTVSNIIDLAAYR